MRLDLPLVAAALCCAVNLVAAGPVRAGGLSCSVGEVVIENLKIGHRYSLASLANLPLSLTNLSDQAMRVSVEPQVPDTSELRRGAEPIPASAWASALPDTLDLPPRETRAAELILDIPDDEALMGRKFEVVFWSHNLPQPGQLIAYGLKSRVIFSIDRERDTTAVNPGGDLSLSLLPGELHFENLVPGRTYRLERLAPRPLRVRNTSSHPVRVTLETLGAEAAGAPSGNGGADLLRSGVLKLDACDFLLAPGEERTVTGTVSIAKGGKRGARDLMCVISAEVTDQPVGARIYSRVFAHTR